MGIYNQGDIIEFDFSPSTGHEPAGRRPALVVSTYSFNVSTSMTLVCPITTTTNRFPLHFLLPQNLDTYGCVNLEQVRAFDLDARRPRFIESVGPESDFLNHVRECLRSFF